MFNGTDCPCCNKKYDNPKVLRCYHTICLRCIKQNCSPPEFRCPLCAFVTPGTTADRLPQNVLVEAAIRQKEGKKSCLNCSQRDATHYCRQCSASLCAECQAAIHGNEIFRSHEVVEKTSSRTSSPSRAGRPQSSPGRKGQGADAGAAALGLLESCPRHSSEPLQLYCSTCKHSICKECATDGSHRGHGSFIPVDQTAFQITSSDIPDILPIFDQLADRVSQGMTSVKAAMQDVHSHIERCDRQIDAEIDGLIQKLNNRRTELKTTLRETGEGKLNLLGLQYKTLEQIHLNMHHSSSVAASMLSEDSRRAQRERGLEDMVKRMDGAASPSPTPKQGSKPSAPSGALPITKLSVDDVVFPLSTVVNVGGATKDLKSFILSQRVDISPCVETSITTSFAPLRDEIATLIGKCGKILARRVAERHFPFSGEIDDHEGILHYLGCGRGIRMYNNPTRNGMCQVTCSSVGYGRPENAVAANRSQFCTQNVPNSWVAIELERPILLSHYTMHHDEYDADCHFLRYWQLQGWVPEEDNVDNEASVECSRGTWKTISSHENDTTIHASHPFGAWGPFPGFATQPVKKLRILMTGPNSNGNHYLMLSAVELYGTLLG